ncbi:UDP-2,3-diacylglucosamine diphosphatase [Robiginitalea sp. IMCC43444]|uniref:UDP-2,3-diacylglucosamine diphosphatase n=1 Tax=Robiginitalea sp. IMCC43444 TaxID=3459121 RepID=UPI0040430780
MKKRKIDLAVISDVHLGTYGCHAQELLAYLSSIEPGILVLNGDIIDAGQFDKRYFHPAHLQVLRKITGMAARGTQVYYITGNRDEMLRKFSDTTIGSFRICDKLVLELDDKKAWFFHGDVFDLALPNAQWLARLGGHGYKALILLNRGVNNLLTKLGRNKISLSGRIKKSVKGAAGLISNFEKTAASMAISKRYDYVICGHIHQPKKEWVETSEGRCLYLNSGDWVENLTALEYAFKRWKLYWYNEDKLSAFYADEEHKATQFEEIIYSVVNLEQEKRKEKPLAS